MIFPNNKSITAVFGQPLTLTMEFCANPAYNKVYWIAKDRVYKPGEADSDILAYAITNSTPNCHQAVLYLSKVRTRDIGEYSFVVRSAKGLAEGMFNVNMTYASGLNINAAPTPATGPVALIYLFILLLLTTCC